ncbi:hypothetical protein AB0I51_14935 [Streptomyces sp. NPDC050549]|uniref:hypothetical protein n=1 Tax=Streptomyces sp. NPDC050549 TaxID=3155406 RepID=UPI0034260801
MTQLHDPAELLTSEPVANASRHPAGPATLRLRGVGVAIFRTAFGRWAAEPDAAACSARVREAADELAHALDRRCPVTRRGAWRERPAVCPAGPSGT